MKQASQKIYHLRLLLRETNSILDIYRLQNSLNRQYVRNINKLIENMEESPIDPIEDYRRSIGPKGDNLSFTFKNLSMSDFRKILSRIKPTGSSGEDDITIRMIKQAQTELEPALLHLNQQDNKIHYIPSEPKNQQSCTNKKSC